MSSWRKILPSRRRGKPDADVDLQGSSKPSIKPVPGQAHAKTPSNVEPTDSIQQPSDGQRVEPALSTIVPSRDLWAEADAAIRAKEPALLAHAESKMNKYDNILAEEETASLESSILPSPPPAASMTTTTLPRNGSRLTALMRSRLDAIEAGRGNADYFYKGIKIIVAVKDFVASVASQEPHAALAWAGVTLLLPVILNPDQQHTDVVDGLNLIPDLLCKLHIYKRNVACSLQNHEEELYDQFCARVVQLYTLIFEYEARALCQFSRPGIVRYGRDVLKIDKWKLLLDEIRSTDSLAEALFRTICNEKAAKAVIDQQGKLDRLLRQNLDQADRTLETVNRLCHQAFFERYADHKDQNPSRVLDTCAWFFQSPTFLHWRDGSASPPLLWLSAEPGQGKSVLSKVLIDDQQLGRDPAAVKVCFHFFKDESDERRSATRALVSLIHQLLCHDRTLVKYARPLFDRAGQDMIKSFSGMWSVFESIVKDQRIGNVVCLLEAFDECDEAGSKSIVQRFSTLFEQNSDLNLKILVTSRPYAHVHRAFRRWLVSGTMLEVSSESFQDAISDEISIVIKDRVPQIAADICLSQEATQTLETTLLATENKTYLWLYLILETVEKAVGISTSFLLARFLTSLPATVDQAYEGILQRSKDKEEARRLLSIVVAAERPLAVEELKFAMATRGTVVPHARLEVESDEDFVVTARNLCGLFIRVIDSKVVLLHQTAREFLLGMLDSELPASGRWKHCLTWRHVHLMLSTICVHYLRIALLGHGPCTHETPLDYLVRDLPFIRYAALYWGVHAKNAEDCGDVITISLLLAEPVSVISLVQAMFYDEDKANRWHLATLRKTSVNKHLHQYASRWTDMHLLAYLGLEFLMEGRDSPLNVQDEEGFTPLTRAALQGHIAVVELLLRQPDVDVNITSGRLGYTALHLAASEGNHTMVKVLLAKDAIDIDRPSSFAYTPLCLAAAHEHQETVSLLLASGAEVDALDPDSTPLMDACSRDSLAMARLLIDAGADLDADGRSGGALSCAIANRNEGITTLLIDSGVNIGGRGHWRRTPICEASHGGHHRVVSLLLAKGADPNEWCGDHGNAYTYAVTSTGSRHLVIQLLLENGADPAAALYEASRRGAYSIVRALLAYEASKWAKYHLVDEASRSSIDRIIDGLPTTRADPNAWGGEEGSAYTAAVINGYAQVADFLLANGADPDSYRIVSTSNPGGAADARVDHTVSEYYVLRNRRRSI